MRVVVSEHDGIHVEEFYFSGKIAEDVLKQLKEKENDSPTKLSITQHKVSVDKVDG